MLISLFAYALNKKIFACIIMLYQINSFIHHTGSLINLVIIIERSGSGVELRTLD